MFNNFHEYAQIQDCLEKYGSFCVEGHFDWAKHYRLPSIELDLPQVEKQGKIVVLHQRQNPISLQLSDGSRLFFSKDEFKRIDGVPEVGRSMKVVMIRLPGDASETPSQIKYCKVF